MKLSELRPCAVCRGKLVPVWYVMRVSMAMLKAGATRSTLGLAQHFGGISRPGALAIAEAMSPDPDCVTIFGDMDPSLMTEILICQPCYLGKPLDMALLIEEERKREERERDVEAVST